MHGTDDYVPQAGDIGLTQIHGRVGAGIRVAQWMAGGGFWDYEHAFVCVGAIRTSMDIIEAEPGGAELNPLDRYEGYNVSYLRCPDEFRLGVSQAALKLEGIGYSFLDYESLFLAHIGIKADWLENYIRSTGHMICSQLADEAAQQAGWHLFNDGRWSGDVIPAHLYGLYRHQQELGANWRQMYP